MNTKITQTEVNSAKKMVNGYSQSLLEITIKNGLTPAFKMAAFQILKMRGINVRLPAGVELEVVN